MSTHRGKQLAELIRDAGLDQTSVASRIGITPQAVSGWTTGRSTPGLARLMKLDQLLGNDGRVLAIYGKPASRTLEQVVDAAMTAATSTITTAVEQLQAAVDGEVRSQLDEHQRLLDGVAARQEELAKSVAVLESGRRRGRGPRDAASGGR